MKKIFVCAAFVAVPLAASAGESALRQLGAGDSEVPAIAAVAAPAPAAAKADIFASVDACRVVDVKFIKAPLLDEALRMLQPCLKALSSGGLTISAEKGRFYSRPDVLGFQEGIEIIVAGEAPTSRVARGLEAALAARGNGLLSFPARVMDRTTPHVRRPENLDVTMIEPRGLFKTVDACRAIDTGLTPEISLEDAVARLQPCMEALSGDGVTFRAGKGKYYSRPYVQGFEEGIQIGVTGEAARNNNVAELKKEIALRGARLFNFRAWVLDHRMLQANTWAGGQVEMN